jgi:hypothetical protein
MVEVRWWKLEVKQSNVLKWCVQDKWNLFQPKADGVHTVTESLLTTFFFTGAASIDILAFDSTSIFYGPDTVHRNLLRLKPSNAQALRYSRFYY